MNRRLWTISALLSLWVASGATCLPQLPAPAPVGPPTFLAPPTLDEVAASFNDHAARVVTMTADSASISAPGTPSIRASLAVQRPRHFRLKARAFGPELDIGSNDQGLWFWANSDPNQAVYVARHEQLAATAGQPFPVDAEWLVQAFGLVELAPHGRSRGALRPLARASPDPVPAPARRGAADP